MNLVPTNRSGSQLQAAATSRIPEQAIAWVGGHLFGLLAAAWPASANGFNNNVRHSVELWCRCVHGYSKDQILEVVNTLALDPGRQFAPRPAEVRDALAAAFPKPAPVPKVGVSISRRAVEMQAEATVYTRHKAALGCPNKASAAVTREEVEQEEDRIRAELARQGVPVTDRFRSCMDD